MAIQGWLAPLQKCHPWQNTVHQITDKSNAHSSCHTSPESICLERTRKNEVEYTTKAEITTAAFLNVQNMQNCTLTYSRLKREDNRQLWIISSGVLSFVPAAPCLRWQCKTVGNIQHSCKLLQSRQSLPGPTILTTGYLVSLSNSVELASL